MSGGLKPRHLELHHAEGSRFGLARGYCLCQPSPGPWGVLKHVGCASEQDFLLLGCRGATEFGGSRSTCLEKGAGSAMGEGCKGQLCVASLLLLIAVTGCSGSP